MSNETVIENDSSSSNLVVRGDSYGVDVTLDPMIHTISRLTVYPEEAREFLDAVRDASAAVEAREIDEQPAIFDPDHLRELASYAEDNGGHANAEALRELAGNVELYGPIIRAVQYERARGEYDRERIEDHNVALSRKQEQ